MENNVLLSVNLVGTEREIHRRTRISSNVDISQHATERMQERGIVIKDMFRVLREGYIDDSPIKDNRTGDLKYKIKRKIVGRREVGVITVVPSGERLIIVTVEWEDLR